NRVLIFIQSPAGNVELMRALVAGVAVSCLPEPMPVVMSLFFIVGTLGCWSEPAVVMKRCRWFTVFGNTERITRFYAKSACHIYIANAAFMQEVYSFHNICDGTVLEQLLF